MFSAPLRGRRAPITCAAAAVFILLATLSAPSAALAQEVGAQQERCLALAIYFEARGESESGQRAVAEVVLARVRSPGWPKTICGVVYQGANNRGACQFSFACDGQAEHAKGEAWLTAQDIAADALDERGGAKFRNATYFHTTGVRPSWSRHMVRVARIGAHIFYRPRA